MPSCNPFYRRSRKLAKEETSEPSSFANSSKFWRSKMTWYEPLGDAEMRAIKIQPSASGDIMVCTMKNVKSIADIKFVALSYVWGNAKDQVKIMLNGKSFYVTQKLHEALIQLRAWSEDRAFDNYLNKQHSDGSALWFWIDAICINQRDEIEKSREVPKIGSIYSEAELVICWLGRMESLDEKAVHWIFGESAVLAKVLNSSNGRAEHRAAWKQARNELGSDHEIVKSCFLKIIARPWFTRLWTLQEAVLAKSNPIYAIDRYMSSELARLWFDFSDQHSQEPDFEFSEGILSHMALSDIHGLRKDVARARAESEAFDRHERARQERAECEVTRHESVAAEVRSEQNAKQSQTSGPVVSSHDDARRTREAAARLVHIMTYTATRHASLPHDMIYGLLGLAFTQLPNYLTPDYNLPYTSVYQHYARFFIEECQNLVALTVCDKPLANAPSWVPDFQRGRQHYMPPKEKACVSFSADGRMLRSKGVSFGNIVSIWNRAHLDPRASIRDLLKEYEKLILMSSKLQGRSFRDTLIEWLEDERVALMNEIRVWEMAYAVGRDDDPDCPAPAKLASISRIPELTEQVEWCLKFWDRSLRTRTQVLSSSGVVVALYNTDAEITHDDMLCALQGAGDFFLLRPCDGRYRILSACQLVFGYKDRSKSFFSGTELEHFDIV